MREYSTLRVDGATTLAAATATVASALSALYALTTQVGSTTPVVGAEAREAAAPALGTQITGEAFQRWRVSCDGTLTWGPGTVTRDTTLARSGPAALNTPGSLSATTGLLDGVNRVYSASAPMPATINVGVPSAVSGIVGAIAICTLTMAAFPYPTLQRATMTNYQVLTLATDAFDSSLSTSISPAVPVGIVRSRASGNGSVGAVSTTVKVAAGAVQVWQTVMSRASGTGSASSVADNTLNRLEVLVLPAV